MQPISNMKKFKKLLTKIETGGDPDIQLSFRQDAQSYEKGSRIYGAEQLESTSGCLVFHAGTSQNADGQIIANGGRVLCVTALGATRQQARMKAYAGIGEITWDDGFYRSDIAAE